MLLERNSFLLGTEPQTGSGTNHTVTLVNWMALTPGSEQLGPQVSLPHSLSLGSHEAFVSLAFGGRPKRKVPFPSCPQWDTMATLDGTGWHCQRRRKSPGRRCWRPPWDSLCFSFQAGSPEIPLWPSEGGWCFHELIGGGEPTGPCLPFPATLGPCASPTLLTLPPAQAGCLAPATRPAPAGLRGLTREVTL